MGNKQYTQNQLDYFSFRVAYDMCNTKQQTHIRKEIAEKFGIALPQNKMQVYNIINGKTKINPLEKSFIEELFKKYNINPWTSKLLRPERGILLSS